MSHDTSRNTTLPSQDTPSAVVDLAARLVACPSITPADAGAQAVISERLVALGFSVTPVVEGESKAIWAELIREGKPLVVFSGHTDVVPPGDLTRWTSDPFTPVIRDGDLYGRGITDMKGNIAAFIVAIEEFLRESSSALGISIGVLIAGDEEGLPNTSTANVMKHLASIGRTMDYCINAEPTSVHTLGDTVKNGRRGSCDATIRIQGVQGHSAYPERAKNAIHLSLKALDEVARYDWDRGCSKDDPKTGLQITSISAGTGASNVIPGTLDACFNMRYPVRLTEETIRSTVEGILRAHALDFSVEWSFYAAPFQTNAGKLLEVTRRAIKATTGVDAVCSSSGGTSDARFIAPYCSEVLEFGLVGASMHAVDEHAKVADMEALKDIFKGILAELT